MKLYRPFVSALSLSLTLPAVIGTAHAGDGNRLIYADIAASGQDYLKWKPRVRVITSGDDVVDSVGAELTSDGGDEDLVFVESNAWLHGTAAIAALPTADASLSVVLYDAGSAALVSFSGTLSADGSVALWADATGDGPDVQLLGAELFTAQKGYELGVNFEGAATYKVAYAVVTVTEGGGEVCVATDEKGNCLKWEPVKEISTSAEVAWTDIGAVWEADTTVAHEGLIELKVKTYDAKGKSLDTAKSKLGLPWRDGDDSVNALATDEDPLTKVAMFRNFPGQSDNGLWGERSRAFTIVSEGWTVGDALPVDAVVELASGETFTIPVNSYQRRALKLDVVGYAFDKRVLSPKARIAVTGGDVALADLTLEELRTPACSKSTCVVLLESEKGEFSLSVSRYSVDAAKLPDAQTYTISVTDELGEEGWPVDVEFADDVAAVFANTVDFIGDPVGLGFSGKVKLLGAPKWKGKQAKLGSGKFYAQLEGDLHLLGGDKGEVIPSSVAVSGEALSLDDGKGGLNAPPVIVYANGSGTKNASSQISARPQLF